VFNPFILRYAYSLALSFFCHFSVHRFVSARVFYWDALVEYIFTLDADYDCQSFECTRSNSTLYIKLGYQIPDIRKLGFSPNIDVFSIRINATNYCCTSADNRNPLKHTTQVQTPSPTLIFSNFTGALVSYSQWVPRTVYGQGSWPTRLTRF